MKHDSSIEDPETPKQWDVSAAPNVLQLIRPTRNSKRYAEMVLVMVNAIEMRRNMGEKKM
jgi:hypothetical protein